MEWIFYIVGGIVVFVILSGLGVFTEIFTLIGSMLVFGLISGIVSAIFSWGFGNGFGVGIIIGIVAYIILCISRICSDNYTITFFENGSHEKEYESWKGWVGLITAIVLGIIYVVNY